VNFRNRRSLPAFGLVAILAVAGCTSTSTDPTPTPTEVASLEPSTAVTTPSASALPTSSDQGGEGEDVSVFDLEVGDCFRADSDQVESVTVLDCDQPHFYESFALVNHEAGDDEPFPGDDAIVEFADTECQAGFEAFVDLDYQSSIWYITSVTPSEETWAQGDREIVCTLNQQDEAGEAIEVSGSAEGSAE